MKRKTLLSYLLVFAILLSFAACAKSPPIPTTYEEKKARYNEIVEIKNTIWSKRLDYVYGRGGFKGTILQVALDMETYCVVVWLDDISRKSIASFREHIYDSPYLIFEKMSQDERPVLQ